jgi:hypothetical protein
MDPPECSARDPRVSPAALSDLLEALGPEELALVVARAGIELDAAKRIGERAQVARALAGRVKLRGNTWTDSEQALLVMLARAGGRARFRSRPAAANALCDGVWLFEKKQPGCVELILPVAYLLQFPPWEGEDPRGIRSLLAHLDRHQAAALTRYHSPRVVNAPWPIAFEAAFRTLMQPTRVRALMSDLGERERQLLSLIAQYGGEVTTQELLEMERQPLRLETASGASQVRSGAGYELERRGLLLPAKPNRHLVPTEVLEVVTERKRRALALRRAKTRRSLEAQDMTPRRARFAVDPAPLAVALALLAREQKPTRAGVATPLTIVKRLAKQVGADVDSVALLCALGRRLGLWEPEVPRAMVFGDVGYALYDAWQAGALWDEGRLEPEILRNPKAPRQLSPASQLRVATLEALLELAERCWVPWKVLLDYVLADPRGLGLERQQSRWGARGGGPVVSPEEIVRRTVMESLATLGAVHVGEADDAGAKRADAAGGFVRLSDRGRAWLSGEAVAVGEAVPTSDYVSGHTLRIGPGDVVADLVSVASLVELGETRETLDLLVSRSKLDRAFGEGVDRNRIATKLAALAPLSGEVERMLEVAARTDGRAEFASASGFLWVDDPSLLEQIRAKRGLAALFVDPSPPGGLLVSEGVTLDRLTLRCRAVGIEIYVSGARHRLAAKAHG